MAGTSPTTNTGTGTLPIDNLINHGTTGTGSTSSSQTLSNSALDNALQSQLGPTAFLQLLTTQLQNQDPLNPMDDTQSVTQLAQFSQLQSQVNLQQSFSNFQSNFAVLQSAQLIGQTVSVNSTDASGNSSTVTGTVQAVQVVNGVPEFTLIGPNGAQITGANGQPLTFQTSQITGIGAGAASSGTSSTGSTARK
jgi:flagellar basal-body rod modification protein FlgD